MTHYRFLEPLDVLFLRGNKLFGDPGSYGDSLIPPWPSVAAGAIRSRMLADEGVDFAAFARGEVVHPTLGTPDAPGSFVVTGFRLALNSGNGLVSSLHTLPADLIVTLVEGSALPSLHRSHPVKLASGLRSSSSLSKLAVLSEAMRAKATSGWWLKQEGWAAYLSGKLPDAQKHIIHTRDLWKIDERVGVGLSAELGRADDGKLFTTQAVALQAGVGFIAGIDGAEPPDTGLVRLGGDGRAAAIRAATGFTESKPDYVAIAKSGRCRIVLTGPGLFETGWMLPGVGQDSIWQLGGVGGRVVCAAVPRAETVSGWDLARWQPKPAQRVAPAGSVYWIEDLQATPDALRKLSDTGLWRSPDENAPRHAEGYNRFSFAIA